MSRPLAYLLTWHTYGTWLHGDERGSMDREHNVPHTPTLGPNRRRANWEARRLKSPPLELDDMCRSIVTDAITDHCRQRNWDLLAIAVQSNHVHVVVGSADIDPEGMMTEFKAWATRRLRLSARVERNTRLWVRHGSTRYLWNAKSVNGAIAYVREGQDVPK